MDHDADEERLQTHQDARLYPLGRVLRSTFDADNHDTLGSDVTGLMIDLSKVPDVERAHPAEPQPGKGRGRRSILTRLSGILTK